MSQTPTLRQQQRLFELLTQVVGLTTTQRERVLEAEGAEVAQQVRALLQADPTGEVFLDRLPDEKRDLPPVAEQSLQAGAEIGPYRILEHLGSGGMGQVYLAQQREPIQRQVALKVLRHSLARPEARHRFVAERQAMARLQHPNVGQILDAGTTAGGVPYLAMERIDGEPITTYCDRRKLEVAARLRLFVQVCLGVDHAHRKFLLHRDIKPSNVLVTEVDGAATPKLIDFGIAKRLDNEEPGALMVTREQLLGTPQYMSPEALGLGAELDTRSDVYSLGVLLYQLLCGQLPWGGDEVLARFLQRRASEDPDSPSHAVRKLSDEARQRIAQQRGTSAEGLPQRLRGDLDHIVAQAIAADPDERYASAADLAADLERHLAHEPVRARTSSRAYLLRKTLRRHRLAAGTTAVVVAALALGSAVATRGLLRAREAEDMARRQAAISEQARAEAEQVTKLLTGIFAAGQVERPSTTSPPSEISALELLERGSQITRSELQDQPRVRARLEQTIATAWRGLGRYDEAMALLSSAQQSLEELAQPAPYLLASVHYEAAQVHLNLAQREQMGARLEQALALLGTDDEEPTQRLRAEVLIGLGQLQLDLGNDELAESHLQEAMELGVALEGRQSVIVAEAKSTLANGHFQRRRWVQAEELWRQALDVFRALTPPGTARRASLTHSLAAAVASQGRLEEAQPIAIEALSEFRRLYGAEHHRVANSLNNLGVMSLELGQPKAAATYHRDALRIREQALGPDHPRTAWSLDNLARAVAASGGGAEAEQLQLRALGIRERHFGSEHIDVARSLAHLSDLALARGSADEALPLRRRALRLNHQLLDPGHAQIGRATVRLGIILWHLGQQEEAQRSFSEGLRILEQGGEATADDLADAQRRMRLAGVS